MSDTTLATFAGYDPGGNGKHGLALLTIYDGTPQEMEADVYSSAEEVIKELREINTLLGIGIDTLTCWSTGSSGWRPADRWLRKQCQPVQHSIVSPNGLYGSMGINGMSVLLVLRSWHHDLVITETHPKVLYWELYKKRYDYSNKAREMDTALASELAIDVVTHTDHEWDAALSLVPLLHGYQGKWNYDLHEIPTESNERLVWPCGKTHFFWPSADAA